MKIMKCIAVFAALLVAVAILPSAVLAAGPVAKIGTTEFVSFDDAVAAAADGDTIEVLTDCTTVGLDLSKSLVIQGAEGITPSITFTDKGIALFGKKLTFKNCNVVMNGVLSTPNAELTWMTINLGIGAEISLQNATMTLDAAEGNAHAIYFCGNNELDLTSSSLTIKNYVQDALEWDGGSGKYDVSLTNSTFVSQNNREGFTGTFNVTITNSSLDVLNSTASGSNGSNFTIKNSTVNFNDNASHGLSAGKLDIDNSTVNAMRNGINGIVGREITIDAGSHVRVEGNSSSSSAVGAFRVLGSTGSCVIDAGADVEIINNYKSGIQIDNAAGTMTMNSGSVMGNGKGGDNPFGGGVFTKGCFIMSDAVRIYNNHAAMAGDDIYVDDGGTAVISDAQSSAGLKLDDCNHSIDGWYDDGEEMRWNAHGGLNERHMFKVSPAELGETTMAIKAAHGPVTDGPLPPQIRVPDEPIETPVDTPVTEEPVMEPDPIIEDMQDEETPTTIVEIDDEPVPTTGEGENLLALAGLTLLGLVAVGAAIRRNSVR